MSDGDPWVMDETRIAVHEYQPKGGVMNIFKSCQLWIFSEEKTLKILTLSPMDFLGF